MPKDPYKGIAEPERVVESIRRRLAEDPAEGHEHGHEGPLVSIREAEHKGHQITIRTEYTIEIDGEQLRGHFSVEPDGQVHYHSLPNYEFASTVDLVKKLIDVYPRQFDKRAKKRKRTSRRDDGGHH